jgi:hypothetical protein
MLGDAAKAMSLRLVAIAALTVFLPACGGTEDAADARSSAGGNGPRLIDELPDPCDWLSGEEAQALLGLPEAPRQTRMGTPETAGRSCVYTNAPQTAWINVSYEGLNPQVFNTQGRSARELVETASSLYAHGLDHVLTEETGGLPTLGFQNGDRTIMVVFTDIGKARDLPEGFSDRLSMSTYYNVLMHLFAPHQAPEQRLAALNRLADRPLQQLVEQARR